jgi:hypothetical protein
MATVNAERNTLLDVVSRTDSSGAILPMVEYLQSRTPVLQDATWIQANGTTGHKYVNETALPTPEWRKINQGITPSKSRGAPVTESAGLLEGRSEVDVDLARLNGNGPAFRMQENKAFQRAMGKELETGFFYHSTLTAPEKFMGLAPRLDATTSTGGGQIVLPSTSPSGNDQSSIWLVGWGEDTVSFFYLPGMVAGFQHIDMGMQSVNDGTGKEFLAWVSVYKWNVGLMVKDWRYVARIPNLDTSSMAGTDDTIVPAMIDAVNALEGTEGVRPVFYMNRRIHSMLHKQARTVIKGATITTENIGGKPVSSFLGIPIRVTDAILNTESVVS